MSFSPTIATLLEKCAADNGFDQEGGRVGNWLAFTSSQARLEIWLTWS